GLPGPCEVGCAQMHSVFLLRAVDGQFDTLPGARVHNTAIGRKIERHLNEATIIFEPDIPTHPNGEASGNHLAAHAALRNTTHDLVGHELPARTDCGHGRFATEVVDHRGGFGHRLAP